MNIIDIKKHKINIKKNRQERDSNPRSQCEQDKQERL